MQRITGQTTVNQLMVSAATSDQIDAVQTATTQLLEQRHHIAVGQPDQEITGVLRQIQNDLFDAGADLSTPVVENPAHPPLRITQPYIDRLEGWCDKYNEQLPALDSFVLPGGSPLSALLHVARTVARRAERSAWAAVFMSGCYSLLVRAAVSARLLRWPHWPAACWR